MLTKQSKLQRTSFFSATNPLCEHFLHKYFASLNSFLSHDHFSVDCECSSAKINNHKKVENNRDFLEIGKLGRLFYFQGKCTWVQYHIILKGD